MQTNSSQDFIGVLSVLDRRQSAEQRLDEALLLPLAWQPEQWWRVPLQPRACETASEWLPDNETALHPLRPEPPPVTLAMQYAWDHYPESLFLEQVAGTPGAETIPLGPLIRLTSGVDFSDYVASVRIEKAKNLLLNPNYSISEIASELGLDSLPHFTGAFTRMVGESPRSYRARLPARLCHRP